MKGKLFIWGNGLKGQLGHKVQGRFFFPMELDAFKNHFVLGVACGGDHTVVISTLKTKSSRVHQTNKWSFSQTKL